MSAPGVTDVGFPKNYLRPCLLLLLAEGTSHGYDLIAQLAAFGLDKADAGGVYRCLRSMDEDGLVRSTWEPSSTGPARRSYQVTEDGLACLLEVEESVAAVARGLGAFLLRRRAQRLAVSSSQRR